MPLTRKPSLQPHLSLTTLHSLHQAAPDHELHANLALQAAKATGNGRRIQSAEREVTAAGKDIEVRRKAELHEIERLGILEREKWEKTDRERRKQEEKAKREAERKAARKRKWGRFMAVFGLGKEVKEEEKVAWGRERRRAAS